jgi:hypothetical protein
MLSDRTMRRVFAFTLAAVASLGTPALAEPVPSARAMIAAQVQQQLRGDPAKHSQAEIYMAIRPVDIDGNNLADWQIDWKAFGAGWCGTGGCRYQLWLGRAKREPRLVFDRQMRGLKIDRRDGRTVFVFDFHGGECGGFGSQPCPGEFTWDARAKALRLLPTPARHTAVENPLVFGR